MISASPTATSAAAMAMENNANVCPPLCGKNLANATRFRLAAFMTISTANSLRMKFRFTDKPYIPIAKSATETITKSISSLLIFYSIISSRQDHRTSN